MRSDDALLRVARAYFRERRAEFYDTAGPNFDGELFGKTNLGVAGLTNLQVSAALKGDVWFYVDRVRLVGSGVAEDYADVVAELTINDRPERMFRVGGLVREPADDVQLILSPHDDFSVRWRGKNCKAPRSVFYMEGWQFGPRLPLSKERGVCK